MVHILSPFLREPIPAHLAEYYQLIDEAEVRRPKKGDDGLHLVTDFDHCMAESRKYVNGLEASVTGKLGETLVASLRNLPEGTKREITFAYPIRPKNEGETQQQVSRSLCIALAEFYGARYSDVTFSVTPFYQMQDQRRTRNQNRKQENATLDTKLGFSRRSRFAVHNETSLEDRIIVPVDNGVESGETFAEMVSCITRHGGMTPVVVAPYVTWDKNFAPQPATRAKFKNAFNGEQREELDRMLLRFGLSSRTLTDIEMRAITELGFEKTKEELQEVRKTIQKQKVDRATKGEDELAPGKFINMVRSHGTLTR